VAVIDSGIAFTHPDLWSGLHSRVVYAQSFVAGDTSTADKYGHGTHVAGLIGGNGNSSTGPFFTATIKGVAPAVSFINLRVLDQNGQGTDSAVIAGLQQAIALKSTYNIRVINLSPGGCANSSGPATQCSARGGDEFMVIFECGLEEASSRGC